VIWQGVLLSEGPQGVPEADGTANMRVKVVRRYSWREHSKFADYLSSLSPRQVRQVVDPEWQTRDVVSAMNFLRSVLRPAVACSTSLLVNLLCLPAWLARLRFLVLSLVVSRYGDRASEEDMSLK